jgi:hypothetical protein
MIVNANGVELYADIQGEGAPVLLLTAGRIPPRCGATRSRS